MTWPQINEKLSYLPHLSFFSPPHNSVLVSVKKKNISHCSLASPLHEVYQWKTWETDFAASLKVQFKVQVAKLLQRIEANVSDTGDMQRRGKLGQPYLYNLTKNQKHGTDKAVDSYTSIQTATAPKKTALWSDTAV